jgi:hypothetical protein
MASLEQRGNRFRVIFRLGGQKHRVSVNAPDKKDAEACLIRLEENMRLVERGRLAIPDGADVGLFLLSDGKLEQPVAVVRPVRLGEMFETYRTEFTAGAKEAITREMENIHLNHLARLIGGETPVAALTAGTVQQFVDAVYAGPRPAPRAAEDGVCPALPNRCFHRLTVLGEQNRTAQIVAHG